jgi:hypothetical protein
MKIFAGAYMDVDIASFCKIKKTCNSLGFAIAFLSKKLTVLLPKS